MKPIIPILLIFGLSVGAQAQRIVVGSKKFTESYVLGEIAKTTLQNAGFAAEVRQGMGGTIILWQALQGGEITLYPEYTGTIDEEILKTKQPLSTDQMGALLRQRGVGMTGELGFNNTYALVMRRDRAAKLGIGKISDLRNHPDLIPGLTHEFLDRQDGWTPLSARYGLQMRNVRGIDHALGYAALANGSIDLKDAYSTDARIAENDLVVLDDDLHFFPQYKAVFLYRLDMDTRAVAVLETLVGTLDEARMTRLNSEAERTKNYALAAALYFGQKTVSPSNDLIGNIERWTLRHLELVGASLFLGIIAGIPLGIRASRPGPVSNFILATSGVIQTIPSLALLALLVPLPFFGISPATAIFALFLYSLLPIVRNTATGLQDIPMGVRESAAALGLEPHAQLWKVFLPLASRTILAGVKTSAIINVGTATLAALIGVGGLGEPIISGLNLNDYNTILQGAIPAALLALLVQFFFDGLDRIFVPKGLRLKQ
ncbi:MAG TPA: glycine betaine ABC transporter substrate-binding protein [Chthoniobacterales bacterium]|jgi:osmoprotectant transport system permease protein|nr:glycine betaine ABC transporter substrate-binding protein [Chthoniobacterales bacterium]